MCGICGSAHPASSEGRVDKELLVRMRDLLEHRGPDDAGIFIDGGVGLGHRRLSIVDLAGGHQPMANEDSTIWICYNGEIYNHRDFRSSLQAQGHVYRTASDTETIVHLYEEYGARAVEHLRGMFAFAIWDSNRRKLVLARDRLGIKPLYYAVAEDRTIHFASEIKALIESGVVRPELNYDALADYAANRCTSGDQTLFRGVNRLLPGHTLTWSDGQVEINRYWDLSFTKAHDELSDHDYVEQFIELFRESVRLRLMSDVPLGMFLSGGIDSSAIAAVMSQMSADPIKTFSVAFAEREANELDYARLAARTFGTEHYEVVVSPQQFFNALPGLVYQEDEPIAHPSSVPLYFVSELAARHVKVVLTGEGSDELLAGYAKYRKTIYNLMLGRAYQQYVPKHFRRAVKRLINKTNVVSLARQKMGRSFLCREPELVDMYLDNFAVFTRSMQQRLFTPETRERMAEMDPYCASLECIDQSRAAAVLDQLLACDMKTYLPELLMKQDQMSMSASIESRVPFLDHHLVEFAARLPLRMKLRGINTKYVLRQAMASLLPKEIVKRKKMGFPVPIGKWLRSEFTRVVDEYVLAERAIARGIFQPEYVSELVNRHRSGEDHSERLWALVNFEIWQRRFFDGQEAPLQEPVFSRTATATHVAV